MRMETGNIWYGSKNSRFLINTLYQLFSIERSKGGVKSTLWSKRFSAQSFVSSWNLKKTYLEQELGLEKQVQESQPEQGAQSAQQWSSKVQVTSIWGIQSRSGETSENDGREHKSIGNDSRINHDSHFQEWSCSQSREESESQQQSQSGTAILAIVRGCMKGENQTHAQESEQNSPATE